MIGRYRLLAERIRAELRALDKVVTRAEGALARAIQLPLDQDYFLASASLDMHGCYAGLERLFELIAVEIDESLPSGLRWHGDLLAQMALDVPGTRPPVLLSDTPAALEEYLQFRHVVRNVYTFNLRQDRVAELVRGLRPAFERARNDLLAFAGFLDDMAVADEDVGPEL